MSGMVHNNLRGNRPQFYNTDQYNKPYVSNSKDDTLNDAINILNEKYGKEIDVYVKNIEQENKQSKDIQDIKSLADNLSSSMKSLSALGSIWQENTALTVKGVPDSVKIQLSDTAKPGYFALQVNQIAQKQRISIQSVDHMGNPQPFPRNAVDVTSPLTGHKQLIGTDLAPFNISSALTPGTFAQSGIFRILSGADPDNATDLATITIPGNPALPVASTLQDIANLINQELQNNANRRGVTPIVTAFVQSDNRGSVLVLESTEPGTANDFYIDAQYIVGIQSDGIYTHTLGVNPVIQCLAQATANQSAISTLAVSTETDNSIRLFTRNGREFSAHDNMGVEIPFNTFIWTISGNGASIDFSADDLGSLDHMANKINSEAAFTGVMARVEQSTTPVGVTTANNDGLGGAIVSAQAGYTLVVYGDINYNHASLEEMYGMMPNSLMVRGSRAQNTIATIDGAKYDFGGETSWKSPTPDIDSITMSVPTTRAHISITQDTADTAAIKKTIEDMVNSINAVQKGISEVKKSYNSRMPSQVRGAINGIESMLNTFKFQGGVVNAAKMGLTWENSIFKIDDKKLQSALTNDLSSVKSLFTGSLTQVGGGSTVTLAGLSINMQVPQFDLNVTNTVSGMTASASNYGGGGSIPLTYTPITATTGLITGQANTIFSGLSMKFSMPAAGLVVGVADISNITIGQGVASTLLERIKFYDTIVRNKSTEIGRRQVRSDKRIKALEKKKSQEIRKVQMQAAETKRKEKAMADFRKMWERSTAGSNYNAG